MITRQEAALEWLISGKTSPSTMALCAAVCGKPSKLQAHPVNGADFGRCMDFLRSVPQAKAYLYLASNISTEWGLLVSRWIEIEGLFIDEVGIAYDRGVSAVRTTALLRAILASTDSQLQGEHT